MGSIFEPGDTVELSFEGDCDSVDWKVFDFWQREIEKGIASVSGAGGVSIKPKVRGIGYYRLRVVPWKDGSAMPDSYASFAIVRPHPLKAHASNPFGVMTHFAQGMNPDMLPLFKKIGITSIRDEHYWADVERSKGVYQFSKKSTYYMAACQAAGTMVGAWAVSGEAKRRRNCLARTGCQSRRFVSASWSDVACQAISSADLSAWAMTAPCRGSAP